VKKSTTATAVDRARAATNHPGHRYGFTDGILEMAAYIPKKLGKVIHHHLLLQIELA
jgi:hypothetical protein